MMRYGASLTGASATLEERPRCADHGVNLTRRHSGEDGERKDPLRVALRVGESADLVPEVGVGTGQVHRNRIVSAGADSSLAQEVRESGRVGRPDPEQVPYGGAACGHRRQLQIADARESLEVLRRDCRALAIPLIEVGELLQQHERLDRVEPCRVSRAVVDVLRSLAVLPKRAHIFGELLVIRYESTGVAERAEILPGVEAERSRD